MTHFNGDMLLLLRKHGMQVTQNRAVVQTSASKPSVWYGSEAILISSKEQQPNGKDLGQSCLRVEGASPLFLRTIRQDSQEVTAGGRTAICTVEISASFGGSAVHTHTG